MNLGTQLHDLELYVLNVKSNCYLIFLALVAKGSDGWATFGEPVVSSILPNVDNAGFSKTGL